MPHSQFGRIRVGDDFQNFEDNIAATGLATAIVWGTGFVSVGGVGLVSVNEGSLAWTIDEPGGILALTTDTGDDDNACLIAGRWRAADSPWMEVRHKFNSATLGATFAGFSETMALDTPVMPAEFATATMTYNGTGGMMGAQFDTDGTTDDFRACAGDGAAATGSVVGGAAVANGIRANETITADEWYLNRVELDEDGTGRVYVGHRGDFFPLIAEWATAPITRTDMMYAVAMFENRSGAARLWEVDYLFAEGHRDWARD